MPDTGDMWDHDPGATLDYTWDWSQWMRTGDSIASRQITVPTGWTSTNPSNDATSVTTWLATTLPADNADHRVTCRITTAAGRIDERTIRLFLTER